MEHSLYYCPHCFSNLKQALTEGFTQDFQLLQNGLIYLAINQKKYDLEDIIVYATTCTWCTTTQYHIITNDGIKGLAIEHWEIWSEYKND